MSIENNRDNRVETAEEIHERRKRRIQEMKEQKRLAEERRKKLLMGISIGGGVLIVLILIILLFGGKDKQPKEEQVTQSMSETVSQELTSQPVETPEPEKTPEPPKYVPFSATATDNTKGFSDAVNSTYAIIMDVDDQTILAQRNGQERISPASMTKVLTVLTAAKALGLTGEDWAQSPVWNDTFTMTLSITDYCFVNDCSNVGFLVDEQIPIIDLFYGTIMPSGADAAIGLAEYIAGDQDSFVEMMNKEVEAMGLSATSHFTNCVGLYDAELYSTAYDIGVIMKEAMNIPFLREVMTTRKYTTQSTEKHADGMLISNLFLRRIEDRDTHSEIIGGKTGYVVQSKSCAVSYAKAPNGKEYICVTAGAESKWKCIYDHVEIYQQWIPAEAE